MSKRVAWKGRRGHRERERERERERWRVCTKMLSLRWGGTSRVVAQRGSLYLLALTLLAASPVRDTIPSDVRAPTAL